MGKINAYAVEISVVMPVFNTPVPILKEAVDSILNQTFRDFEFIIIDDGSDGETVMYLDALDDPRIKIIRNETNIGITKSLNIGFQAAQGKYIARMDADDISLEERFDKQYAYMETHSDVALCGCAVEEFGTKKGRYYTQLGDPEFYRIKCLFYYPGPIHPTFLIRKRVLDQHGISYNEELTYVQDYGLLVDISALTGARVFNLPEVLLKRRNHGIRITVQHHDTQKKCTLITQRKLLRKLLVTITEEEANLHYQYFCDKNLRGFKDFCICFQWCIKLSKANHRVKQYSIFKFDLYVFKLFMLVTGQSFMPKLAAPLLSWRNKILIKQYRNRQ